MIAIVIAVAMFLCMIVGLLAHDWSFAVACFVAIVGWLSVASLERR